LLAIQAGLSSVVFRKNVQIYLPHHFEGQLGFWVFPGPDGRGLLLIVLEVRKRAFK
jgi:hypothetical protein